MSNEVFVLDHESRKRLPRVLSLRDAAEQTGLSYGFLRGLCTSGSVVCFRVGRAKWVINADSLAAYLNNGGSKAERI